jgi:peptidoglycan/xylan/chitin deacetylase (PgdA/CDA1 family)
MAAVFVTPAPSRAAAPHQPVRILSSVSTTRPDVALTFDDGPSPYTPTILSILRRYRAHATFFVVGREVQRYPELVRAEHLAGDEIGNHTYTHADLQYLTDSGIASQIESTQAAVHSAAGVEPAWMRPPYGAVDLRVAGVAASLGLQTILWSVDPRDWSLPGPEAIVTRVLAAVQPGSVVIMHDGGGDRSQTAEALLSILDSLRARGYRFLTLSELFAAGGPCDLQHSLRRFAARGIRPHADHAIFQQWENLYCSGADLGPATSAEYRSHHGLVRQDFAATGHRLVWNPRTDAVRTTRVWPWAIQVYDAAHVYPAWHTAITAAWFREFFGGDDWGPAESTAYTASWGHWQRFRNGTAIDRGHSVTWQTRR